MKSRGTGLAHDFRQLSSPIGVRRLAPLFIISVEREKNGTGKN